MKLLNTKTLLATAGIAFLMGASITPSQADLFFNEQCHQVCDYIKDNAKSIDEKIGTATGAAEAAGAAGAAETLGIDEAAIAVAGGLAAAGNSIAEGFQLLHCLQKAADMKAAGCERKL